MHRIREKHHRLPLPLYRGTQRVSFTAKIQQRTEYFLSQAIFERHVAHLQRSLSETECQSELYLFMPDHLHVIITGCSDSADARVCMSKFKQYSGFDIARTCVSVRWQKDFFDYIHRNEADLYAQMRYILNNPVRKGLCENWQEYAFKGSTVFDLDTWSP